MSEVRVDFNDGTFSTRKNVDTSVPGWEGKIIAAANAAYPDAKGVKGSPRIVGKQDIPGKTNPVQSDPAQKQAAEKAQKQAAEADAKKKKADQEEAQRQAAEADAKKKKADQEEAQRQAAEADANAKKKKAEQEEAQRQAAEADKKARATRDEDDRKAALKAAEEATRKKIEAEKAQKEANEKAAAEKIESDRKERDFQELIKKKEKEAAAANTRADAEKKQKELDALKAAAAEAEKNKIKPTPAVTTTPNNYPDDDVINNAAKKHGDNKPSGTPATTTPVAPPAPITGTKLPPLDKPADNTPAGTTTPVAPPAPVADNKPADNKPEGPEGPSLWDRIKAGASEIGQAIGGALTPNNTPSQTPGSGSETGPNTKPAPTPAEQRSEIEKRLDELDKSPDPAVRQRAQAARAKLNGPSVQPSGAKVQAANVPSSEITSTSKPAGAAAGTAPGTAAGTAPGTAAGVNPGTATKPVPAVDSDVDNDKIRRDRRIQDAEIARLQQLVGNKSTESGGWRDAGSGTRIWRGKPGTDPKWPGYVFSDGSIMPAAADSTGVDPAKKDASGKPISPYVGGKGSDKYDSQKRDQLLLDKERAAQQIDQLKKQLKEDFNRILKLSGFNR
jgi:chemotaxis protein histidine kinase CheA